MTTAEAPLDVRFERFESDEYARRWDAIERMLDEAGADVMVVFGNQNARADIQYLTAWAPRQDSYLVAGGGRPPALRVQLYNHVPTARLMSVVEEVEWAGADSIATVAEDLRARGPLRRIALLGPMPWQAHARLAAALGDVKLVDLGSRFRRHRLVKSPAEIEWMRRGAELSDAGITGLVEAARPGIREHELGAAVEAAYERLGGQHGICFIAAAPMSGGGRVVPSQHWSSRRLERGDAVMIELSAGVGGYTGQVLRTVAVDAEPPAEYRALHDVASEAFAAIVDAIRPGATAAEIEAVAGLIDRAGYSVCDDVVHGYGGGYLPPVLRTPATAHGPAPDLELRPGMMLVVQPNVITLDGRLGVQTGELVVVTDDGAESLHHAPR
ncbi:MAG TPA: Xaa-Pro peptidase family protein, partial [Candidatus Limnocylindrales bacterium]|nr:Xaa-Pro peptidase family protein [Candidatus Limnocylindrales bacterium]